MNDGENWSCITVRYWKYHFLELLIQKKLDELIRKDTMEAGISCLNKKDPEHLEHTYQFQEGTNARICWNQSFG